MDVNDTAKCHLIGIYKLLKSETKVTIIALVQYTLKRTLMKFQLLYHRCTSGSGLRPKPKKVHSQLWTNY